MKNYFLNVWFLDRFRFRKVQRRNCLRKNNQIFVLIEKLKINWDPLRRMYSPDSASAKFCDCLCLSRQFLILNSLRSWRYPSSLSQGGLSYTHVICGMCVPAGLYQFLCNNKTYGPKSKELVVYAVLNLISSLSLSLLCGLSLVLLVKYIL